MSDAALTTPFSAMGERLRQWCLRHLARPSTAQTFVPQIDGLRFVAIMAVLFYHMHGYVIAKSGAAAGAGWINRLAGEGGFGVPLFFALSGYILGRPFLADRGISVTRYFTRRLTRLEPPYILNLLMVFAVKLVLGSAALSALLPALLASLVYSHGFAFGTQSLINGVAWSLEVEWQFYLLAPVLFFWLRQMPSTARHATLLAAVLLGGWVYARDYQDAPRLALSLGRYFGFFAAGAWVAVMDVEERLGGRWTKAFDLLGVTGWSALVVCLITGPSNVHWLPLLTALVLLASLRGAWLSRLLGWWPLYCTGGMCYSIYLYHFFVISAVGRLFSHLFGWPGSHDSALVAFAAFCVPIVLVICALPYLLIERPFMAWRPGRNNFMESFRSRS